MAKSKGITDYADELEKILEQKEPLLAKLEKLKEKEDKVRQTIVKSLLANGLQYIKTSSGLAFGIVQGRKTFSIREGEQQKAITWAQENYPGLLTLKMTDTTKVLKPMLQIPSFFEEKVGEPHLAVRSSE